LSRPWNRSHFLAAYTKNEAEEQLTLFLRTMPPLPDPVTPVSNLVSGRELTRAEAGLNESLICACAPTVDVARLQSDHCQARARYRSLFVCSLRHRMAFLCSIRTPANVQSNQGIRLTFTSSVLMLPLFLIADLSQCGCRATTEADCRLVSHSRVASCSGQLAVSRFQGCVLGFLLRSRATLLTVHAAL
jgi:hypothetical protein